MKKVIHKTQKEDYKFLYNILIERHLFKSHFLLSVQ